MDARLQSFSLTTGTLVSSRFATGMPWFLIDPLRNALGLSVSDESPCLDSSGTNRSCFQVVDSWFGFCWPSVIQQILCQSAKCWRSLARFDWTTIIEKWGRLLHGVETRQHALKRSQETPPLAGFLLFERICLFIEFPRPLQSYSFFWGGVGVKTATQRRDSVALTLYSLFGSMLVTHLMWVWHQPCGDNGRNRTIDPCPKRARWLTLTCFLFWLLLQLWAQFQLRFHFDPSLSIRNVGTRVIQIALPGIKPTNPTGRFKIKKFLLLISVMVEPLLLQDQDLKLPTDSDQQIRF